MDNTTEARGFTESCPVVRFEKGSKTKILRPVAREYPLTIFFNSRQLVTMLCSPEALKDLAVGFLSSEGFLRSREEIKSITLDSVRGVVRVQTVDEREISPEIMSQRLISSGCGRGAAFYSATDVENTVVTSSATISGEELLGLVLVFQHASPVYRETHGVHSAALYRGSKTLVHAEDIGRHNAVDKIFGHCLLEGVDTRGCMLITSGRISSEIAHKAVKKDIPILVSISAPTTLAVEVAEKMGITLVASVRGDKMDVYTNSWRITSSSPEV
jgi:FdhD protein